MTEPGSSGTAWPLRAPRRDEHDALLHFIAAKNQPGAQHCLHFAETVAGIEADIARDGIDLGADFLLATNASGWLGTAGLQRDGDQGWLLGPWTRDAEDSATRTLLLNAVMQTPGLARLRSFSNVRCVAFNAELAAAGFELAGGGHVMQIRRSAWRDDGAAPAGPLIGEAADGDEPALAELHREAFPNNWLPAEALLAYARKHGTMLVAQDATHGLLGSLCLRFYAGVPEADVEFLAVQPAARRGGVGRALLLAALREAFRGARCEHVNLVVNDTNPDAKRLYQASGFEHLFSGVGMRWPVLAAVSVGGGASAAR